MIFQDPMTSLNPVFTVGDQIAEGVRAHLPVSRRPRRGSGRCALLQEVGIPDPAARLDAYPAPAERRHAAAGDDRDRAVGRARDPGRRRAHDRARRHGAGADPRGARPAPTRSRGMAVLLITHDLGIVAGRADRVAVMYAGQIVEEAHHRASCSRARRTPTPRACSPRCRGITGPVQRLTPIGGTRPAADRLADAAAGSARAARRRSTRASCRPSCCRSGPSTGCAAGWRRASALSDGAARGARPGQALHSRRPLRPRRAAGARGGRRLVRRGARARRSRWWARRAAASRRWGAPSCGCRSRPAGSASFEGVDLFALDRAALRRLRRRMQIIFQDPYSTSTRG